MDRIQQICGLPLAAYLLQPSEYLRLGQELCSVTVLCGDETAAVLIAWHVSQLWSNAHVLLLLFLLQYPLGHDATALSVCNQRVTANHPDQDLIGSVTLVVFLFQLLQVENLHRLTIGHHVLVELPELIEDRFAALSHQSCKLRSCSHDHD